MDKRTARQLADGLTWTRIRGTLPITAVVIAGVALTLLAAWILADVRIEGDVYGLLGRDDPAVSAFDELARVTPGLEELLVVCAADHLLDQQTLATITAVAGIEAHTRTYFQPGKSTVHGFSLGVDPADWRETRPVIAAVESTLSQAFADCGLTGTPAVVQEMQSRINADLKRALTVAALLVSLLFAFAYRIGWLALLMLVPVLAGIAWGMAAYSLLRGELTLLAATVPTLLVGIGIDHCIHMIQSCRYSMASEALPRSTAVLLAWRRLLRPISLATLTTAVTFFSLSIAGLRGLADLGWSGALVTLGVYAACISLLPVILLFAPEKWLTRGAVFDRPMQRVAPWLSRNAGRVALVMLLTAGIAAVGVTRIQVLDDNRLLESGDLPSLALQDRIAVEHGLSSSPLLLRFHDPDDAIELLAEIERPPEIGNLLVVPGVDGLLQVHPLHNTFIRRNYHAMLGVLDAWIATTGLGTWELSGAPVMNERINELVYADVRVVVPVAAIAILIVLALGTGSVLQPCLILLPLLLALAWLVGTMGIIGIAASVVTVAIMPLMLGIGVDGGVHLLASWQRHGGVLADVLQETGLAIVISVLTSVTAFAAFLFARSPSLVYFGSQAAFALAGCLVVTLFLLPVLFRALLPAPATAHGESDAA